MPILIRLCGVFLTLVVLGCGGSDFSAADSSVSTDSGISDVLSTSDAQICATCGIGFDRIVRMSDGVGLVTHVFTPASTGLFPTVLVRNPYRHLDADRADLAAAAAFHTSRGFAYVWQNVRGTAGSEGVFTPFVNEARDGRETTEWIAAQPWSNGRIATIGGSYLGTTALAAAVENPLVKLVIADDSAADERSSHRGGVIWGYLLDWLHLVAQGSFFDGDIQYARISSALELSALDTQTLGMTSAYWRLFLGNIDNPTFPTAGSIETTAARICAPTLHVYSPTTTWTDPIDIYRLARTVGCSAQRDSQRLFVVTEPHTYHLSRLETAQTYLTAEMLAALDRIVRDGAPDFAPGARVTYAVAGESARRTAADWPPTATLHHWYLTATQGDAPLADTAPNSAMLSLSAPLSPNPCDAAVRPQQWFTSATLPSPIVIAGRAELSLGVRSALRDFDLFVHLYDYAPATDEYAQIATGYLRVHNAAVGATPPTRRAVTVQFTDAAHRIAQGHQLTFSIATRECTFAQNPQTGDSPSAQIAAPIAGTISLETGGAGGSRLTVPLVQ